ncbi:hypothetical protein MtrunA17_Chr1g0196401 [Medicago truncatula]|uniref:Uncharacterized protein n=1 Tax=Medicago truncatula TaxID=3880 RepID=A0A396JY69_MEDTR|nr:hypothetical protein MtrunA17_Chr1g0196401 [Medicago truncatula]
MAIFTVTILRRKMKQRCLMIMSLNKLTLFPSLTLQSCSKPHAIT